MTRELVESFLTIVRLQSISKAAESLYISQSTLSHRLQVLESELHTKLFHRQRGFKQIMLTESGKEFIPLASQWLDLDDNIHETLSGTTLGKITIGSMDSLNQYLLNEIILEIKKNNPKLNLEFVSYHSQEIYSRLISGYIDIAFAFHPVHYDINTLPIFNEPMYMICPVNSIYPEGPIHPYKLRKADQIFFQWNPKMREWNDEWWSAQEAPYVKVDSTSLLTTFLTEPYNWAVCPASVATNLEKQGLVKIHEFEVAPPNRICYLLQKKQPNSFTSEAVKIFLNEFFRLSKNHPWKYIES